MASQLLEAIREVGQRTYKLEREKISKMSTNVANNSILIDTLSAG